MTVEPKRELFVINPETVGIEEGDIVATSCDGKDKYRFVTDASNLVTVATFEMRNIFNTAQAGLMESLTKLRTTAKGALEGYVNPRGLQGSYVLGVLVEKQDQAKRGFIYNNRGFGVWAKIES